MNSTFQSVRQLLLLALPTTIAVVGCGDSGDSPNGEASTDTLETVPPSQPDSPPETASSSDAFQRRLLPNGRQAALGPLGLKLDYERIKASRPKIAELLRAE